MTNIISEKIKNIELLAPAGSFEKLITAIHFGAPGEKANIPSVAGRMDVF